MGIMTSYGSYNDIKKPIIMDNLIIAICNSSVSFIAGFAVWSVVGFLEKKNHLAKSKTSSAGLAFIAYPSAVDMMSWPNFWAIVLGLVLFLLGIDSAFAMVEATSTVVSDLPSMKGVPRKFIAFVLCGAGFLFSIPFCTNWGFILFDVIDHYLCTFLLLLVGILQCIGCGWGYDVERTINKSTGHKNGLLVLSAAYWINLLICGVLFVAIEKTGLGILVFIGLTIFDCLLPSFLISRLSLAEWYQTVAMCGVRRIGYSISKLGREEPHKIKWYEPAFVFYWGFTIKFFIPATLWFILVGSFKNDVIKSYGGYAWYW